MGEKAIVEWNNRSLADLYRAKLKILFRLRSFAARPTGFDEGHLNRSTNIDSIRSMDARLHTQANERLLGIYQVERVSPEWNVSFVKRGQYRSESQWLGRSPFFSQFLRFKQWNLKYDRRETLLAFSLLSPLFFENVDKVVGSGY